MKFSSFFALLFLGCLAACATSIPLGRVDELLRTSGARTILLEEHISLYSPYELIMTRPYLERIETGRAEVFGLFEVESERPLTVWLRVDPELGVHASVEGDRMRIESVSLETHDGVLGEADGSVVVIRVAPLDVVTLSDGRTITGTLDASMYAGTIRHELAHAAAFLLGVYGKGWLKEGLAHVVEWIPIEGGRLELDPVPEELRRAAGLPAELRSLDELLAWEQALPPTDDDRAARLLSCSLVAFLLDREGAPRFRDGVLRVAALDEARILALQEDWSAWLDGLAPADPTLGSGTSAGRRAPPTEDEVVAFVGGTLFPAPHAEPIPDGVLLVAHGKITAAGARVDVAIPAEAERVDCAGGSVVAGFWNCHVHFTEPKWTGAAELPGDGLARELGSMLTSHGFVHAFDTGSDLANTLALRARIERGEIPGPSLLTAGTPFAPPGGSPFYIAPMQLPELATPEEAAQGVRARLGAGADAIKLFAASPAAPGRVVVMPQPILTAAVTAAHAEHRLVLAHPTDNAGVEAAVQGGVDVVLHTTPDGGEEWDEAFAQRMHAAGVALVPTLQLWAWELQRKNGDPELLDRFVALACRQLGAFARAGGEVLFGTDVGYMSEYDPTEEFLLMEQAGLDWRAILAALTTAPARRFGLAARTGTLAPGMDADVVVLGRRPDQDVRAFAQVRSTWRGGSRVHPSR